MTMDFSFLQALLKVLWHRKIGGRIPAKSGNSYKHL